MKCGLILAIMTCLLVGISSGGFFTDSIAVHEPSWTSFSSFDNDELSFASFSLFDDNELSGTSDGLFGDYEPLNLADWFDVDYEFFNLAEYIDDDYELFNDSLSSSELVPLVMPYNLPSKEELYGSLTTESKSKQSLLSSKKNNYYFKFIK